MTKKLLAWLFVGLLACSSKPEGQVLTVTDSLLYYHDRPLAQFDTLGSSFIIPEVSGFFSDLADSIRSMHGSVRGLDEQSKGILESDWMVEIRVSPDTPVENVAKVIISVAQKGFRFPVLTTNPPDTTVRIPLDLVPIASNPGDNFSRIGRSYTIQILEHGFDVKSKKLTGEESTEYRDVFAVKNPEPVVRIERVGGDLDYSVLNHLLKAIKAIQPAYNQGSTEFVVVPDQRRPAYELLETYTVIMDAWSDSTSSPEDIFLQMGLLTNGGTTIDTPAVGSLEEQLRTILAFEPPDVE